MAIRLIIYFFVLLQNCNQREDLRRFIHYGRGETVFKKLGDIIHEFTHRKSNQFQKKESEYI